MENKQLTKINSFLEKLSSDDTPHAGVILIESELSAIGAATPLGYTNGGNCTNTQIGSCGSNGGSCSNFGNACLNSTNKRDCKNYKSPTETVSMVGCG